MAFAAGGEVQPILERFEDKPQEVFVYIRAVKLWIRRWDGRPIVGGSFNFFSMLNLNLQNHNGRADAAVKF